MQKPKPWVLGLSAVFGFAATSAPALAAETWVCEFSKAGEVPTHATFTVVGSQVAYASGDVLQTFKLVADDEKAIVAAHGGGYASEPEVMAFTVLIDKKDGRFVLSGTSVGDVDYRETGRCKPGPPSPR